MVFGDSGRFPMVRRPVNATVRLYSFSAAGLFSASRLDRLGEWGTLFALSFSAYWVLMGTGRLGIHEQGIWGYWGLLSWSRIRSYEWAHDGTLLVQGKGPLFFLRGALPVPSELQPEFSHLLEQHVLAARTT